MRYLILSDIHGNWDALRSVLRQVRRKHFDSTLVLGDLVGYGAAPGQVLAELSTLSGRVALVRGNHDKLVAGIDDGSEFNEIARAAASWTRARLNARDLHFLQELPCGPLVVEGGLADDQAAVAICHGSPADEDTYLFSEREAWEGFLSPPGADVTFFGHTHLPSMFALNGRQIRGLLLRGTGGRVRLRPGVRYLINPGSIGQPRDRNPKAAYMVYDSDKRVLRWRRVSYAIERAQRRIRTAGLPSPLADRLSYGV